MPEVAGEVDQPTSGTKWSKPVENTSDPLDARGMTGGQITGNRGHQQHHGDRQRHRHDVSRRQAKQQARHQAAGREGNGDADPDYWCSWGPTPLARAPAFADSLSSRGPQALLFCCLSIGRRLPYARWVWRQKCDTP